METAHFEPNRNRGDTSKTSHLLAIPAAEQEGTQGSENTALRDTEGSRADQHVEQGAKNLLLALFPKIPGILNIV